MLYQLRSKTSRLCLRPGGVSVVNCQQRATRLSVGARGCGPRVAAVLRVVGTTGAATPATSLPPFQLPPPPAPPPSPRGGVAPPPPPVNIACCDAPPPHAHG